ncbi:MAG TPA: lipopolysaccharide biosynthesis protein, partial [Xanthobacteraceae bacterium]|nr:lipopolysaccharide biosynthesis protein [Xanthobacteraceae bacterium]
ARVDSLGASLDGLKKSAGSSNELDVQLRALEREAKAQRDLFESYLAKYREATSRETIASAPTADSRIISRAVVSKVPYFPKKLPTILVAALGTMLLSGGIIVTGEILRAPPRPPPFVPMERMEAATAPEPVHPAIGVPVSAIGEAAQRVLDTAGQGRRISVLGVAVGDTTLAALTLARAMSKTSKVVLVSLPEDGDADAPLSGLAVVSSNPEAPGLANVLRGEGSIRDAITRDRLSNLQLVAAGTPGRDAVALMRGAPFVTIIEALARAYDFLVLDAGTAPEQVLSRIADIAPRALMIAPNDKKGMIEEAGQRYAEAGFGEVTAATTPPLEPAKAA